MTQFEFVLVFISIVAAFAVSDILANWGEQIRLRHRVRHYPLHTAWMGLLLFVMMQVWWSLWGLNEKMGWTFGQYLALVFPFLTLALMAYILTPNLDDEEDIKKHYFETSTWFFSLAAIYLCAWAFYTYVIVGKPISEPGSPYRLAGTILMVVLAAWQNERVHIAAVVLAYLLMGAWIATVVL
ncbi:MAG: hypothetical protein AAF438_01450 [Pseudomonadota bacterium]